MVADQYLSFRLEGEEYAIEVYSIKEVIKNAEVTEVPNITSFVKGVISLRGMVIPVVDFKRYLGLSDSKPSNKARMIIVGHKRYIAGLSVDSVGEVINVSHDKVNPIPRFMEKERREFFKGVVEYKDRFIMVLKTDILLEHIKN